MEMTLAPTSVRPSATDCRNTSARIRAELEKQIQATMGVGAQVIECELVDGVLILRGMVPSFHSKQMAQETARRMDGIRQIVNRLLVNPA